MSFSKLGVNLNNGFRWIIYFCQAIAYMKYNLCRVLDWIMYDSVKYRIKIFVHILLLQDCLKLDLYLLYIILMILSLLL